MKRVNVFKKYILAFLIIVLHLVSYGQDWVSMMNDSETTFEEVCAAFYASAENGDITTINGWKQFKRWEYYYKSRLDQNGKIPKSSQLLKRVNAYYAAHPKAKNYDDGTGTWQEYGPIEKPFNKTSQPNGNGRISCIAFHPTDPNILFVGAPSGGFWKSTDAGQSWKKYVTGLVRLGVSAILVHPTNPDIIYIGTGDRDGNDAPGYGVWRSIDGGLTWSAHSSPAMSNLTINDMVMNPNDPNNIIAISEDTAFRTVDGGNTWISTSIPYGGKDIAFHPSNPSIVYTTGRVFYKSENNGQSFTRIIDGVPNTVYRMALAVTPLASDAVYLIAGGNDPAGTFKGVYKSTNAGASFVLQSNTPNIMGYANDGSDSRNQSWYDISLTVDPQDANTLYAGTINIWKSVDGGVNWTISTHWSGDGHPDVHADQHVLAFSPHNNTALYNGNDGGVYLTEDGGISWSEISSGLAIAQVYKIGVSQQTKDFVVNGYQDNGTAVFTSRYGFETGLGGDGMEGIIDPTNDNYVYTSTNSHVYRSTSGGYGFEVITVAGNGITETSGWVTPFKLDPNNSGTMFMGLQNLWRSTNVKSATATNVSWTKVSNIPLSSGYHLIDVAIASSNSNVLYYSTEISGYKLLKMTDALAASPISTNLDANLPSGVSRVLDIEIDDTDPNHLFIVTSGSGNKVYESLDGGNTWINKTGTLPNITANTIVIDHSSPANGMYLGMDVGVYYRDDNMTDWELYDTGLPSVEITELEIHYSNESCENHLYAATYGRGLWSSDLKSVEGTPVACFEVLPTSCRGEKIKIQNTSANEPTNYTWSVSPNTFSFINGTDANSENPEIEFTNSGTYAITLLAENRYGSESTTQSDIVVQPQRLVGSFEEDFEQATLCSSTSCAVVCDLANLWSNTSDNKVDWRVHSGETVSVNTGPKRDYSENTTAGKYIYLEASNCYESVGSFESECIYLDDAYNWKLAYHMYGVGIGSLHFDIWVDGQWYEDFVTPVTGDQGDEWQVKTIDISILDENIIPASNPEGIAPLSSNILTGKSIKLKIRGITGVNYLSDIAIDAMTFERKGVLPTDILSFSATCDEDGVNTIQWTTDNNDIEETFQLEKLDEMTNTWTSISKAAVLLDKNDYTVKYQTKDFTNYYRLAILHLDGSKKYSNIIASTCQWQTGEVQLYPNPFEKDVTLEMNADRAVTLSYSVLNLLKQEVFSSTINILPGNNKTKLKMNHLPPGVYLIRLNTKKPSVFQVVKQ